MAVTDRVRDLALPMVERSGLVLYDVELNGGSLRVTVDGADGVNLDQLAELTRELSRALDETDPMPGKYTLEVSSPGLERRLRTPEHFAGAIDEEINVKLAPGVERDRRVRGLLTAASDNEITVVDEAGAGHVLAIDDITKAVTVFEWGPAPKPGSGQKAESKTRKGSGTAPGPADDSERTAVR